MLLTKQQLQLMAPNAKPLNIDKYLKPINDTLALYQIDTPIRIASFIAQLIHESGSFRYSEEIADGSAYEGRKDLGNIKPGDGKRFKGRGLIQLTGRANYTSFGRYIGFDFISIPSKLSEPGYSALAAGWFWNTRGLNDLADRGDFRGITKRINGGYNGLNDRIKHFNRCKAILNI